MKIKILNIRFMRNVKKCAKVSAPLAILIAFILSVFLTDAMFFIQPNGISAAYSCLRDFGFEIYALNFLPVFAVTLFFYFLSGNIIIGCSVSSVLTIMLSVINRNKIQMRQDPFYTWDLPLGGEIVGVFQSLKSDLIIYGAIGIIAGAALIYVCMSLIKTRKPHIAVRMSCMAAILIISAGINVTVYSNESLYSKFGTLGNKYSQVDVYNTKGFLYSFIYNFNTNKVTEPENYSINDVRNAIKVYDKSNSADTSSSATVMPNIIFIQNEGFSELALNPHINFDNYEFPLNNYVRIKEESISGDIIVPNYGGGTADTEFDILTGINTRDFRSLPYSFSILKKPGLKNIATVFNSAGYRSIAMHPGFPWFYNRSNVYGYLGFEKFMDHRSYDNSMVKGKYISEEETYDKLIEEYQLHVNGNPETPLFMAVVTIQNHGPYFDKYEAQQNFDSDLDLIENDIDQLTNYFEGLFDVDRELGNLTDYLRDRNEPTIIIYYGDHFPPLSMSLYDKLYYNYDNQVQDAIKKNTAPYLIWQNNAAKELCGIDERAENLNLSVQNTFSSFYLGGLVLELADLNNEPYFRFLNSIRGDYPIILNDIEEGLYMRQDGTVFNTNDNDDLKLLEDWEYYRLFDE